MNEELKKKLAECWAMAVELQKPNKVERIVMRKNYKGAVQFCVELEEISLPLEVAAPKAKTA